MTPALLVAAWTACSPGTAPPPTVDTEPASETAVVDSDTQPPVDPAALHGTVPPSPVAAPDFAARNQLGEARGRADLLGHPTVMWFFPASGTPG